MKVKNPERSENEGKNWPGPIRFLTIVQAKIENGTEKGNRNRGLGQHGSKEIVGCKGIQKSRRSTAEEGKLARKYNPGLQMPLGEALGGEKKINTCFDPQGG